ncbi:MAG: Dyp-type peroxidase [Gammaproteobacteria bacterium]|nr:MAG: Dyp-type peroxidase [Gammaproteobacteria bacterium]
MNNFQQGILEPVPQLARYLFFSVVPESDTCAALSTIKELVDGQSVVVGFGESLTLAVKKEIPGLVPFPHYVGEGIDVPSTPCALWFWLKGNDRGMLLHKTREIEKALMDTFELDNVIDAFQYGPGLDLTGYEDGTENPDGDDAVDAAIVQNTVGLDGSSFVAVQQWVHNLDRFQFMSQQDQDNTIGRRISDNEEIDDAPESAHVKRTAQEDFDPAAFVVRRSMPWADTNHEGLVFVAFGKNFDAFDALLRRMVGFDDGITDALFNFTRPITGSYFWCPPMRDGQLDLSALDL